MENKRFLNGNDVAAYLGVSIPKADQVIRRLKDEPVAQGHLTAAGRVSRVYFEHKACGGLDA